MTMNARGKRWKAVKLDYDVLALYSDENECTVCLTERQAIALIGYMRGMEWHTRWLNLPNEFDLLGWVNDIESRLINMCSCGGSSSSTSNCLCRLTALIEQQINLNLQINNQYPDIPPNDPGENLPAIDAEDPETIWRREGWICEFCKAWVADSFEAMYQSAVQYCAGGEDTSAIDAELVLNSLVIATGALAIPAAAGPAVAILAGLSFTLGVGLIANEISDFFFSGGGGNCEQPSRIDSRVVNAYGCQLARNMLSELTFNSWKHAFDAQDPETMSQMQADGIPLFLAQEVDDKLRPMLIEFQQSGDGFQSFIIATSSVAEDLYYEGEVCPDCFPCGEPVSIDPFGGLSPYIESVTPAPTIVEPGRYTWPAGGWDPIVIRFTQPVCLNYWEFELGRGATDPLPSHFQFQANFLFINESVGGFGSDSFATTISPLGTTGALVLRPNNEDSANSELELRMDPFRPTKEGLRISPTQ